jgi:hypothetical protein
MKVSSNGKIIIDRCQMNVNEETYLLISLKPIIQTKIGARDSGTQRLVYIRVSLISGYKIIILIEAKEEP